MSDDVGKVLKSLEPETVLDLGREVRPILSELAAKKFAKAFETGDASVLYKQATPSTDGVCSDRTELKPAAANPDAEPSCNRPDGDPGSPPPHTDGAGDPVDSSPSPIGANGGTLPPGGEAVRHEPSPIGT